MIRILKNIISFSVLMAFLWPSLIKLEHHHEHVSCCADQGLNYHSYHDKCQVCDFEFSFFSSELVYFELEKDKPIENYVDGYSSEFHVISAPFAFLLRGPPAC